MSRCWGEVVSKNPGGGIARWPKRLRKMFTRQWLRAFGELPSALYVTVSPWKSAFRILVTDAARAGATENLPPRKLTK